eukprot:TRINITY_DN13745_c0_g1_i1.p1 TRINITY_DN13745_c0_g1~~TRINITY_DN13745_c0_g1_i1.p1  ORF type:complete len:366 (+),score=110.98 TRINITY_DN13745_c0_g1_i1:85-1098(+)
MRGGDRAERAAPAGVASARAAVLVSHLERASCSAAADCAAASEYQPPRVWKNEQVDFGDVRAASVLSLNAPTAGARKEKALPVGKHPLQLYSLGTPNGQKVTILLEELHDALGVEYDAHIINIGGGDQFTSGFVSINPNSKIPALEDRSDPSRPVRVFESGAILVHIAEKYGRFLPTDRAQRAECLSWLMWQMGSAPMIGGGFGHFYAYAPVKIRYAVDRFSMEAKRLLDVADRHLADHEYFCGAEYTIADMAILPWTIVLVSGGYKYRGVGCDVFLQAADYRNVQRWVALLRQRPAVRRGLLVNRPAGGLRERHSHADWEKLLQRKDKKKRAAPQQ